MSTLFNIHCLSFVSRMMSPVLLLDVLRSQIGVSGDSSGWSHQPQRPIANVFPVLNGWRSFLRAHKSQIQYFGCRSILNPHKNEHGHSRMRPNQSPKQSPKGGACLQWFGGILRVRLTNSAIASHAACSRGVIIRMDDFGQKNSAVTLRNILFASMRIDKD